MVGQCNDSPHRYIYSGAMSTYQLLSIHFVASLDLTNPCTWQHLHKRKTDKLRETGIVCGKSEGYSGIKREKSILV